MSRRALEIAACLALAGCSDPFGELASDPCAPGNVRIVDDVAVAGARGGACVLPVAAIDVDGRADDWSSLPIESTSDACAPGACAGVPLALQLAETTSPDFGTMLVVRAIVSPPAGMRVVLRLRDRDAPARAEAADALAWTPTGLRWAKAGTEVTPRDGPVFAGVATADGFEARVAQAFLSGRGALAIAASIEPDGSATGAGVAGVDVAYACFDGGAREADPCRGAR